MNVLNVCKQIFNVQQIVCSTIRWQYAFQSHGNSRKHKLINLNGCCFTIVNLKSSHLTILQSMLNSLFCINFSEINLNFLPALESMQ